MGSNNKERRLFWQEHIGKWEKSGLSQAAYCRENKLSEGSFSEWRRKMRSNSLSNSGAQVSKSAPFGSATRFVDVSPTPTTLEIECGKLRIHVSPGFDANHLRRVVEVLVC